MLSFRRIAWRLPPTPLNQIAVFTNSRRGWRALVTAIIESGFRRAGPTFTPDAKPRSFALNATLDHAGPRHSTRISAFAGHGALTQSWAGSRGK